MNVLHVGQGCPDALLESVKTAKRFDEVFEQNRALSYHSECQVTVARHTPSGLQTVVKTYVKSRLKDTSLLQVQTEAAIHSVQTHSNIVRFFVALEDSRHIYMVMEHADGGDLSKHICTPSERRVREFIAAPLMHALAALHHQGIVHRDVKPDNVLVHHNQVLLADFGLAMHSSVGAPFSQEPSDQAAACAPLADSAGGTPLYTAPEVLLAMFKSQPMQQVVQPKNDVWALGVMVLEALTGCHPFSPENCSSYNGNVLYTIAHHKAVTLPMGLSPELQDFLSQALQRDPELRPTAEELLSHPWLTAGPCHDTAVHCRALSAELDASDVYGSEAGTPPGAHTPASSSMSSLDLRGDGTPTKCRTQASHALAGPMHAHMHRAYSAVEMFDCWEQ